jgi:hypothetical protein
MADLFVRTDQGVAVSSLIYDSLQQAAEDQAERIRGNLFALYRYLYADGREGFVIARYQTENGKEFFAFSRARNGSWRLGAPSKGRHLYRLPDVAKAQRVVVVEGEKCADMVFSRLGLVGTTSAFGAKGPDKSDWSPLAGKDVLIVPDQGKPGHSYALSVARQLANLNPPPAVKIVNLPGLEEGEDIEQWLDQLPSFWTQEQIRGAFESNVAVSAGMPLYEDRPTEDQRAVDWLRKMVGSGPVASRRITRQAATAGFSLRTIERAKPKAGVTSKRVGRGWYYAFAADSLASKTAVKTTTKTVASKTAKTAVKTANVRDSLSKGGTPSFPGPGSSFFGVGLDPGLVGGLVPPAGAFLRETLPPDSGESVLDVDPSLAPMVEPRRGSAPDDQIAADQVCLSPADALRSVMRGSREIARRRVLTTSGPGALAGMDDAQAIVLLDSDPERTHCFDFGQVEPIASIGP